MARIKTTNPEDETRLQGLIDRIAAVPMGKALLDLLEANERQSALYTYISFDTQMSSGYGACYPRAGIKTVALNPNRDDDLLASVLMHELVHGLQPLRVPRNETNAPLAYGMISMRLCEGHAFSEQMLFLRQLEDIDPAAAKAGRDFMLDGRFTAAEMAAIDENVDAILASRNPDESRQPREMLFWLTQEYIKRSYDREHADKIKLLVEVQGQSNLLDAGACLTQLFEQYAQTPALLPQQQGLLWPDANKGERLVDMLASHSGISTRPLISLKSPERAAAMFSF